MIVCITEKPSVAADIAKIVGAGRRCDGFYEGNGYCVTWTFGHLCELKEPHDYAPQWRRWDIWSLPMIPPRFGIKLKADKGIEKQMGVIKSLIEKAESVINCGDAGQEGELIQRWVMQKAGCDKPVKRLWISSLTDESIRHGFATLRPEQELDTLYYAGLSRAIGDWLLGMNATRLYTTKYARNSGVLSIGRVQTPTLAMIVARQREIENFVPKDFWELKTTYRDTVFSAVKGRFDSEAKAQEALAAITGQPFTVTSIETKKGSEAPPRLFDLTSLQVECNSRFAFSAEETLRLIQSLYEKKVTTYPRVDTTFLPDDLYPKIEPTLRGLAPYAAFSQKAGRLCFIGDDKALIEQIALAKHILMCHADHGNAVGPGLPELFLRPGKCLCIQRAGQRLCVGIQEKQAHNAAEIIHIAEGIRTCAERVVIAKAAADVFKLCLGDIFRLECLVFYETAGIAVIDIVIARDHQYRDPFLLQGLQQGGHLQQAPAFSVVRQIPCQDQRRGTEVPGGAYQLLHQLTRAFRQLSVSGIHGSPEKFAAVCQGRGQVMHVRRQHERNRFGSRLSLQLFGHRFLYDYLFFSLCVNRIRCPHRHPSDQQRNCHEHIPGHAGTADA